MVKSVAGATLVDMTKEPKPSIHSSTGPTVVATAAVTVAIGITVAALGGYFTTTPELSEQVGEPLTPPQPTPPEPTPAQQPPAVVLVPIARPVDDSQSVPIRAEPTPILADYQWAVDADERDDHHDDDDDRHDHDDDDDDHHDHDGDHDERDDDDD